MMEKNRAQTSQQTIRFFETLLRASADGIVITDPTKNIIFVNDTFCKFFSMHRHDVIETNLFVWLAKLENNAIDIWKGMERQANEHGIAKDVEFAIKTGEGMRYFSVNSSLLEKIDIEEKGLIISIWRDDTERKLAKEALQQAHDELEMRVEERTAQLSNKNIELRSQIKERKKAEEALSESEERYRTMVEFSNDMIWTLDTDGNFLFFNTRSEQISGYKLEEWLGKSFAPLIIKDDLPKVIDVFRKTLKGQPQQYEVSFMAKDGSIVNIEGNSAPIYSKGKVVGTVTLGRDITERKRAEKALQAERDNLVRIFEALIDGVYIVDQKYDIHYVNNVLIKDFGPYEGRKCYEYFHDRTQVCPWCKNEDVFAGKTVRWEWYSLKNDKTYDLIGTPLINPDGTIYKLEMFRDITERKRNEEEARLNSEIFKNVSEGIHLIGLEDGLIKHTNSKFEEMFGYGPGEMIGKDVSILNAPTDKTPHETKVDILGILRTNGEWHGEIKNIRKDGTPFWSYANVSVFDHPKYGRVTISVYTDITERKLAIDSVRSMGLELQTIYDNTYTHFAYMDRDFNFIRVNRSYASADGKDPDFFIGKNHFELYPHAENEAIFRRVVETGQPYTANAKPFEYPDHPEWGVTYWDWTLVPVIGVEKTVTGLVLTLLNVTERKRAEDALRESEEKYRVLVERSNDGIVIIQDGIVKFANTRLAQMWGGSVEGLLDSPMICHIHPNERDKVMGRYKQRLDNENIPPIYETILLRKDGTAINIEINAGIIRYQGKLADLVMIRDITQRKQAEEQNQMLKYSIDISYDGIYWMDTNNRFIYINDAGCKVLGYSREELMSKTPLDINPKATEQGLKIVWEQLRSKGFFFAESVHRRKDGTEFPVEIRSTYVQFAGREYNCGFARDISERKLAEEDRMQLLAREHEARAQAEAARKLDHMKSMFIASTSHELRTPLNSIIGFTSLILDGASGELTPDQKEQLTIVHSSGKHLLALINEVIDISMIEAGRLRVEVSEFNLAQVVKEAVSNLNIISDEKNLELEVDVANIKMISDRTRMLQCMMNLISNAVKYTEKGSVKVTAKVIKNKVEISVTDTGIGIKPEDIPKLFGPFVRLQSPLTLRTSGTGLGLYLVKKLAGDFLGGDIEVKSEFGKGSTFTLRVPVELEEKL